MKKVRENRKKLEINIGYIRSCLGLVKTMHKVLSLVGFP